MELKQISKIKDRRKKGNPVQDPKGHVIDIAKALSNYATFFHVNSFRPQFISALILCDAMNISSREQARKEIQIRNATLGHLKKSGLLDDNNKPTKEGKELINIVLLGNGPEYGKQKFLRSNLDGNTAQSQKNYHRHAEKENEKARKARQEHAK